ncbi:MAG: hypothetical protein R3D68_10035 [Hyphomicrobiaceae bacterium]
MQLEHHAARLDETTGKTSTGSGPEPVTDYDDGLLRTAVPVMMTAYGAAMAIAAFTFWQSGAALLAIAICVVYMAMFFGVPVLMSRIRNKHDVRWSQSHPQRRAERVVVFGGALGRTEALLQMVIVPLAVAFAFAAFATIWLSVSP